MHYLKDTATLLFLLSLLGGARRAYAGNCGAPLNQITHLVTPQTYPGDDDGDGWPTWREDQEGTDPLRADTDGDGIIDSKDPAPLTAGNAAAGLPRAELRQSDSGPQLHVNGELIPFMWFENMSFAHDAAVEQRMRRAGIRVFTFWHIMLEPPQEEESFAVLDARIEQLLAKVPDAYIIVNFEPAHSERFAKQYPGEVLRAADGTSRWDDKILDAHYYTTFASDVWKWTIGQCLTDHINHMMRAPYRGHVIGVDILHGNSGEWWWWSSLSGGRDAFDIDYSPAMQSAFHRYLRLRYHDSLEALRSAWGDPNATFDADIPSPKERKAAGTEFFGRLCAPRCNPRIFDFNLAFNAVMACQAEYFCKIIKRASGGHYIAGVEIHQSLQSVYYNGSALNWPLMDCPQIDFFSAPNDYDRKPGDMTNVRVPWASLGPHHKVFVNESDVRVYNLSSSVATEGPEVWGLKDMGDTLGVLKRNFATLACEKLGGYWMQWERFWYDDPRIAKLFARQVTLSRFVSTIHRTDRNQVAVVADAASQMIMRYDINPLLARQGELSRMGAPYDFYELSDILKPGVADSYRVIIFLNIPALTKQERSQIESLKRDGRTLIWMFCPGVLDRSEDWKASEAAVQQLTGMSVRFADVPMRQTVRLDAKGYRQWTQRQIPSELLYPAQGHYFTAPLIVGDAGGVVLGRFNSKEPAMVGRRFGQWNSIICATTTMAPAVWRDLLRAAGVHLYTQTDDVIAGDGTLLMIHTAQSGSRKISLPKPMDVIELYSGRLVGRNISEFELTADRGRTFFYYLGPAQSARTQLDEAQRATEQDQQRAAGLMPATQPTEQPPVGPFPVTGQGYVTDARVLGPFENLKEYGWAEPVEDDYLKRGGFGCESDPNFSVASQNMRWRTIHLPGPVISIADLRMRGAVTFYLAFWIRLPQAQPIRLGIGSDDQHMLFVNGQRIGFGTPGLIVDNHIYDVEAKAGENLVLLKVTNRGGPGGVIIRVLGREGKALSDAAISTTPPEATR